MPDAVLYDLDNYRSWLTKLVRRGVLLQTVFKKLKTDTPIGESVIIAWILRVAQEEGKPFSEGSMRSLVNKRSLFEEQLDKATKRWLAERCRPPQKHPRQAQKSLKNGSGALQQQESSENVLFDLPSKTSSENIVEVADSPEVSLTENTLSEEAEPEKEVVKG